MSATAIKRFWKNSTILKNPQGTYNILLDAHKLKTPSGNQFNIKSKTPALLLSLEWQNPNINILKAFNLPLTNIYTRALDSVPTERSEIISNLTRYLHTDAINYLHNEPAVLSELQTEHWTPIRDWVSKTYNVKIESTNGFFNKKQSQETIDKFTKLLESYDDVKLAAFEKAVIQSKSFLIALALVNGQISVEEASTASRLEVIAQIKRWGEVEDAHDVDAEDMKRILGAVAVSVI